MGPDIVTKVHSRFDKNIIKINVYLLNHALTTVGWFWLKFGIE